MVHASPGIKVRLYLKNNYKKRAGSMTQVIEHLPSKHKALSSNPSTEKNKQQQETRSQCVVVQDIPL
jgi:hypothetical protein